MPDALTGEILARAKAWERASRPWLNDFVTYEDRYDGNIKRKSPGMGWANTNDLEFVSEVDSVVSSAQAVCFADDPFFQFQGADLSPEREDRAAASQAVLVAQQQDMDFESKAVECLDDWTLHGTCIASALWMYRERWAGLPTGDVIPVSYLDHPDLVSVPLWRFMFEPGATDVQEAEWVIEEVEMNEEELDRLVLMAKAMGNGLFKERANLDLTGATVQTVGNEVSDAITAARNKPVTERKKFTVRKYWGRHPIEKDKPVDYFIAVVNNADWLIQVPNPFRHGLKPYLKSVFKKKKESFYGRGLGHRLGIAHDEMNERNNLMTDICTLALYGVWLKQGGGAVQAERLKFRPGGIIDQATYGQLTQLLPNLSALSPASQMNAVLRDRMRTASGAVANQQGIQTGADTLGEVRIIAGEAARRVAGLSKGFANQILRPWLFMANEMNRQFLDRKVVARIAGRPVVLGREDLLPDPDVIVKVSVDVESRPQMLRRLSSALSSLAQVIPLVPSLARMAEPVSVRMLTLLGVDPRAIPEAPPTPPAVAPVPGAEVPGAAAAPPAPVVPEIAPQPETFPVPGAPVPA